MESNFYQWRERGLGAPSADGLSAFGSLGRRLGRSLDNCIDAVAACPWTASAGVSSFEHEAVLKTAPPHRRPAKSKVAAAGKTPLYSVEERRRRDASPWTAVQAVLAPLQFIAFAISLALVLRYLIIGQGYEIATVSIIIKTIALYAIMITGSIWEKAVFDKWLFARSFFWEDVFSMLVLGLQTAYLLCLAVGWGSPRQQLAIAIAAYAAYAINASQFLLKLRAARLEAPSAPRVVLRTAI